MICTLEIFWSFWYIVQPYSHSDLPSCDQDQQPMDRTKSCPTFSFPIICYIWLYVTIWKICHCFCFIATSRTLLYDKKSQYCVGSQLVGCKMWVLEQNQLKTTGRCNTCQKWAFQTIHAHNLESCLRDKIVHPNDLCETFNLPLAFF